MNLGRAAGAGVPGHLHVHVLPRWVGDTNFLTSVAEARVLPEPLGATLDRLRDRLARVGSGPWRTARKATSSLRISTSRRTSARTSSRTSVAAAWPGPSSRSRCGALAGWIASGNARAGGRGCAPAADRRVPLRGRVADSTSTRPRRSPSRAGRSGSPSAMRPRSSAGAGCARVPSWRILLYSADEPPSMRGLVELDGVDASVTASTPRRTPRTGPNWNSPPRPSRPVGTGLGSGLAPYSCVTFVGSVPGRVVEWCQMRRIAAVLGATALAVGLVVVAAPAAGADTFGPGRRGRSPSRLASVG